MCDYCPACTSRVPSCCFTRTVPLSTIVNSSNWGRCPGSSHPTGLRICATLAARLAVHEANIFVDQLWFRSCRLNGHKLRDEGRQILFSSTTTPISLEQPRTTDKSCN